MRLFSSTIYHDLRPSTICFAPQPAGNVFYLAGTSGSSTVVPAHRNCKVRIPYRVATVLPFLEEEADHTYPIPPTHGGMVGTEQKSSSSWRPSNMLSQYRIMFDKTTAQREAVLGAQITVTTPHPTAAWLRSAAQPALLPSWPHHRPTIAVESKTRTTRFLQH